ncbi:hypothetical protein U4V68_22260, partial [Escherichia coli]|nr:hypothetical protein [Escherichia coli]
SDTGAVGKVMQPVTLSSCGYVYLAVYPTPEMKN